MTFNRFSLCGLCIALSSFAAVTCSSNERVDAPRNSYDDFWNEYSATSARMHAVADPLSMPASPLITEIVTKPFVRLLVHDYIERLDTQLEDSFDRSDAGRHIDTQAVLEKGANLHIANRTALWNGWNEAWVLAQGAYVPAAQDESLEDLYGYLPWRFEWQDRVTEVARAYLKDPQRLQALYLELKPVVLEELYASEWREEIKIYLITTVLPTFRFQPTSELLAAQSESLRVQPMGGSSVLLLDLPEEYEQSGEYYFFDQEEDPRYRYAALTQANKELEWIMRRRVEGGQPLVDMWVWVVQDLCDSL